MIPKGQDMGSYPELLVRNRAEDPAGQGAVKKTRAKETVSSAGDRTKKYGWGRNGKRGSTPVTSQA
jgi:hypothetical protein